MYISTQTGYLFCLFICFFTSCLQNSIYHFHTSLVLVNYPFPPLNSVFSPSPSPCKPFHRQYSVPLFSYPVWSISIFWVSSSWQLRHVIFMPRLSNSLFALGSRKFWTFQFEKFAKWIISLLCSWKNSASTVFLSRQPPADLSGKVAWQGYVCVTAANCMDRGQDAEFLSPLYDNPSDQWAQASEYVAAPMKGEPVSLEMQVLSILVLGEAYLSLLTEEGFVLLFLIAWPLFSGFKRLLKALEDILVGKHENPSSISSSYMKIWAVYLKPKH